MTPAVKEQGDKIESAYREGSKGKYRESIFLHIRDRIEKLDPIPQC